MIRMDAGVRRATQDGAGEMAILNAAARQPQFETLAQAGVRLAGAGITTFEQTKKIVGEESLAPEVCRVGDVLVERGVITPEQAQDAVDIQQQMRRRGKICRFGEVLVFTEVCSTEEIVDAIGVTAGAPELLAGMVRTGDINSAALHEVVREWRQNPQGTSLFEMCIAKSLISKEEIYEPSLILGAGYQQLCAAFRRQGTDQAQLQHQHADHAAVQGSLAAE
jgi:general secretion pathway protein E